MHPMPAAATTAAHLGVSSFQRRRAATQRSGRRGHYIETISSKLKDRSGSAYFIPPPIDAQLGRIPTVHAKAIAANHLNLRKIMLMNLLHFRWL
jgi:hypothetical protein